MEICPDSERQRIMIVEDDADLRDQLAIYLGEQYEIALCANAAEALCSFLESFRCRPHSGILMDLVLPDVNGLRTMSAIRELERGSTFGCVPVRFGVVSGQHEVVSGTGALNRLGVSLRLKKPYDPDTLLGQIAAWMASPIPELYHPDSTIEDPAPSHLPAVRHHHR